MSATYLVTGAAGFIGSHLCRALLARGDAVRGLDDLSTGHLDNVADLPGLTLYRGSIDDVSLVDGALQGVDFVLHHAAQVSVAASVGAPEFTHQVNVTATLHLLQRATAAGVRGFVFAGSCAAYGDAHGAAPLTEAMLPAPHSPYGVSKLAAELYVRLWGTSYGLPTVTLRYFNVYGRRQDPGGPYGAVVARFAASLASGVPPEIYGTGAQRRDFVHVSDVVQANLLACTRAAELAGGVFNIGSGQSLSVLELLAAMQTAAGTALTPRFLPERHADVRQSLADISLARARLGYSPKTGLAVGLRDVVEYPTR